MLLEKVLRGSVLSAVLLSAAAVHAAPSGDAQQCVFNKYAPVTVAPFSSDENVGYGTYTRLRGAQVYVPAQEGLTKEWLAASVQNALAKASSGPSEQACGVPVRNVSVSVVSAGGGFWVQLAAADDKTANVVLRWAQSLVPATAAR
jgi:hypothetical protein